MRKSATIFALSFVFLFLFSLTCLAQMEMKCKQMMGKEGMGEMMMCPMGGKGMGMSGMKCGKGPMCAGCKCCPQEECCPMCGHKKELFLGLKDELELTDSQIAQLKEMKLDMQKKSIQNRANIEIAELEFKTLMHSEKVDLSQVKNKLKQVADLETEMKFMHISTIEKAKDILTPEQKKKLSELKSEMESHEGMGMKKMEIHKMIEEK